MCAVLANTRDTKINAKAHTRETCFLSTQPANQTETQTCTMQLTAQFGAKTSCGRCIVPCVCAESPTRASHSSAALKLQTECFRTVMLPVAVPNWHSAAAILPIQTAAPANKPQVSAALTTPRTRPSNIHCAHDLGGYARTPPGHRCSHSSNKPPPNVKLKPHPSAHIMPLFTFIHNQHNTG